MARDSYTLTRPDVYNSIMMIPFYAPELEDELGVVRDDGADSYDYSLTYQAITIDSRLTWRARRRGGGFYWKTWDVFTGQVEQSRTIEQAYQSGEIRFPSVQARLFRVDPRLPARPGLLEVGE